MPTTYQLADEAVVQRIEKVAKKYHGHLIREKVSIGCLMAFNESGPAVTKTGGYPAAAKVRIVSLKDRTAGLPDAQIIVDERVWDELKEGEREALLDHELEHLKISIDDKGSPRKDSLDRPKLKMQMHDAELGIFRSVIERHGMTALDAQIAEKFVDEYGQLLMWAKDKTQVG